MELTEIFDNYDRYIDIYNTQLTNLDEQTQSLLLNSLYLSVFTSFEYFLDYAIKHYVTSVTSSENGITMENLKGKIGMKYFLQTQKNNKKLEQLLKDPQLRTFNSISTVLFSKITAEELSKYLKFEFLHDNKLKEHYSDIFKQILGDDNFLDNITLTTNDNALGIDQQETFSAFHFISTSKEIRNKIAHENFRYSAVDTDFVDYVNHFKKIIQEMCAAYEKETGFSLSEASNNNILASFS